MYRLLLICALVVSGAVSAISMPQAAAAKAADSQASPSQVTIEGLVRDIACPIQNHEATATHYSKQCLLACARKGSPLIVLTKEGDIYIPVSARMPDVSQRKALMPYLGKYVEIRGTVYERRGVHAIAIEAIREMKNVKLTIEK